jgi:hypothetical protein
MDTANDVLLRIRTCMGPRDNSPTRVSLAMGVGTAHDAGGMQTALREADLRMYQDKAEFKKRVASDGLTTPQK